MNNEPVEVVIREAKFSGAAWVGKFTGVLIHLALTSLVVMWVVPPVMAVFGVEAHPNYGASVLIAILSNVLFKKSGALHYSAFDKNEYASKGK